MAIHPAFLGLAGVVIAGVATSMFVVDQTKQAIVTQFGKPQRVVVQPGLNFKAPFFFESVIQLDRRVLDLETASEEVITSDQKRLVVDAFTRYRIADPLMFFQATSGSILAGEDRLKTLLTSALRRVLGGSTFQTVVRDDRAGLVAKVKEQLNRETTALGISVVDVRIRRADLPEQNSQAIYQRMQTERQREAAEYRAQGVEASERIKAKADRDVVVTRAEAERQAREALGAGDAERTRILAEAYGRDSEFFSFWRSMQAYEAGLKSGDTRMVLSPDSDFFRYLNDPKGRLRSEGDKKQP
ncbi:MAG TPA: protease modulator HflC [Beijerinckiaceae bacterium]|nr:protease modulator HflC [Beijerinckiaceae bacterium]